MLSFQRTLSTQDNVMQNVIQFLVNPEAQGQSRDMFLPGEQAQRLISSYGEAARASVDLMSGFSQLAASLAPGAVMNEPATAAQTQTIPQQQQASYVVSPSYSNHSEPVKPEYQTPTQDGFTSDPTSPDSQVPQMQIPMQHHQQAEEDVQEHDFANAFANFQFPGGQVPLQQQQTEGGLRVFTVGHLAPRQDDSETSSTPDPMPAPPPNLHIMKDHEDTQQRPPHSVRVRRQTFVPGWAVPPKILLVDDDAVYRNMSSKFLQVFGCEADVAVDGISALDKVNMEKYDLILMDVVMPNLDGIAATNMIRQFDLATPIISMTSNIHSNDIMHYFNSGNPAASPLIPFLFFGRELMAGMNDVLPKPFTKDSLLGMLEKHLLHLKQMKQMQEMGYSIPAPIKTNQRLIELPSETTSPQQSQHPQTQPPPQDVDDGNLQFSYEGDYANVFAANGTPRRQYAAATSSGSGGKRRTASDRDAQYEYVEHGRGAPRSTAGTTEGPAPVKKARYNTPPW
jgi:osomolarity two-component system, response regulator SKN7